ncbi:MAG: 1-acyl-sn-glycerol-3-phosphate acyltransferase [Alphaproteobacteria bacterium]|nr:1-acyl-sn-glycerol-3-phosphate acyltransferase [Alphaproteobacteria bacterium]
MILIRSVVFDFVFYVWTFFYFVILFPIMLLFPRSWTMWMYRFWTKMNLLGLKFIVGLDYKIEGLENLEEATKKGPYILACKHQSAWETIIFSTLIDEFQIVLKRQLIYIPVFGQYLKKLNSIVIDRDAGSKAIKVLVHQGRDAVRNGRSILIFPEGTRGKAGEPGVYQPGIAALYRDLNVSVLPVALNSGVFWGRRSPIKRPGVIILRFLKPIPSGLSRAEFTAQLEESIETACKSLPLN